MVLCVACVGMEVCGQMLAFPTQFFKFLIEVRQTRCKPEDHSERLKACGPSAQSQRLQIVVKETNLLLVYLTAYSEMKAWTFFSKKYAVM